MARDFNGSSQKLSRTDACGFAGYPISMACWFKPDNTTVTHGLVLLGSSVTSQNYVGLWAAGTTSGDPVQMVHDDISAGTVSNPTTGFSSGVWQHAGGVLTSSRLRAWLNGVPGTDKSHSLTWPSVNRTGLGVLERGTPAVYLDGGLAEAAIWNVELDTSDFLALSKGVSPLLVRPAGLVTYWPVVGTDSDEDDAVGGYTLTVTGATKVAHPRMIRRRPRQWFQIAAGAPAAGHPAARRFAMARHAAQIGRGAVRYA